MGFWDLIMAKKRKIKVESGWWSEKKGEFVDKPLSSLDNVWGSEKIIADFFLAKKKKRGKK